jgi:hypothetical protein
VVSTPECKIFSSLAIRTRTIAAAHDPHRASSNFLAELPDGLPVGRRKTNWSGQRSISRTIRATWPGASLMADDRGVFPSMHGCHHASQSPIHLPTFWRVLKTRAAQCASSRFEPASTGAPRVLGGAGSERALVRSPERDNKTTNDAETHFATEHLASNLKQLSVRGSSHFCRARAKFVLNLGSTMILARR